MDRGYGGGVGWGIDEFLGPLRDLAAPTTCGTSAPEFSRACACS